MIAFLLTQIAKIKAALKTQSDKITKDCAQWTIINGYYGYQSNGTGNTKNRILVNPTSNRLVLTIDGTDTYYTLTPYNP